MLSSIFFLCALSGSALQAATSPTNADFTAKVIWPSRGQTNWLFVEIDSKTAKLTVNDNRRVAHLSAGDIVHFVGTHVCGPGSMQWFDVKHADILRSEPPDPVPEVSVKDLKDPRNNLKPLSIRATIKDAFCDEIDEQNFFLMLIKDGETVSVAVRRDKEKGPSPTDYIGALVVATGVVATDEAQRNIARGNRRFIGNALFCRSAEDIRIIRTRDIEAFDVPDVTCLQNKSAEVIATCDRHRIAGRVLAVWDDRFVLLKSTVGNLCRIELIDPVPPVAGNVIEAVGFPESDLYHVNLVRSIWRSCTNSPPEASEKPVQTSAQELLTTSEKQMTYGQDFHGKLVELRGIVRNVSSDDSPNRIIIESDKHLIPVALPEPSSLQIGSLVVVTGICVMDIANWHYNAVFPHIRGLFIVPRSPLDVRLLARPPWWTRGRLAGTIGVLFAALFAFMCWIVFLRRFALRKSRELLREQLLHMKADLRTEERTRLSVELHDTVAQNLTGIGLRIDAAGRLADVDAEKMKRQLAIASKTLLSCREELRRCLWDLRSRALDERTMEDAIHRTLQLQDASVRISVRFKVPRARIPDDTAHNVLRIVCELVTNAIRHGQATAVSIAGSLDGAQLLFSVTDNGCGFDPNSCAGVSEGHFGLQGVHERIRRYQGTLDITPSADGGTKVRITMGLSTNAKTGNSGNEIST